VNVATTKNGYLFCLQDGTFIGRNFVDSTEEIIDLLNYLLAYLLGHFVVLDSGQYFTDLPLLR
jgi:hypothetical protein